MGGIADALTGGGSRAAADAQVQATGLSMEEMQKALRESIAFQNKALQTSKEQFQTALDLGEPYRAAGSTAMAQYESLLYGVPVEQTSTYQSLARQKAVAEGGPQIPEGAYYKAENDEYFHGDYRYKVQDGEVLRRPREGGAWGSFRPEREPGEDVTLPPTGVGEDAEQFRTEAMMRTPGYQFRVEEGQRALERGAAARSGTLTGRQSKALTRYGQDVATQEFDKILDRLSGVINVGSAAAGAGAGQAIASGGQQANILGGMAETTFQTGQGMAGAQSQVGAARASGYLGTQAAGANVLNMAAGMFGGSFGGGENMAGQSGGFNPMSGPPGRKPTSFG